MENMEEKKSAVTEETTGVKAETKDKPKKKKRIWLRILLGVILTPVLLVLAGAIVLFIILGNICHDDAVRAGQGGVHRLLRRDIIQNESCVYFFLHA